MKFILVFLIGLFIGNGFIMLGIDVVDKYVIQKTKKYFLDKKLKKQIEGKRIRDEKHMKEYVNVLKKGIKKC
jgi:hypothetical protein